MYQSRLSRFQEKKLIRRLIGAVAGILGLLLFLWFFGFKTLVGLSILFEFLKGGSKPPTTNQNKIYIAPPVIDELPEATNSAELAIKGRAPAGQTVVIYLAETEVKKLTAAEDGTFEATKITLAEGENTITARTVDDAGNQSELSNIVKTTIVKKNPNLEVNNPPSDTSITGDNNQISISGRTDEDNSLTINDRVVIVQPGGNYSYPYSLAEGDNKIVVVATNEAGNQTKVERQIKYRR